MMFKTYSYERKVPTLRLNVSKKEKQQTHFFRIEKQNY